MIKKQVVKEIIGKVSFLVFSKAFMVCENSVCRLLLRLIRRNKKQGSRKSRLPCCRIISFKFLRYRCSNPKRLVGKRLEIIVCICVHS